VSGGGAGGHDAASCARPAGVADVSNGKRFDPRKVKPGTSMARRYADIQAELIQAAGFDISPSSK